MSSINNISQTLKSESEDANTTSGRARFAFSLSDIAKGTYGWIRRNKRRILVVAGWAIGISLIMIRAYWFYYLENVRFSTWKLAFRSWEGPMLSGLDWLLIGVVSLLAVLALEDVTTVFWSYVASIPLSVTIVVAFSSNFIWFVLEYGEFLGSNPYDWEWAVLLAIFNVSRMIPFMMLSSFLGLVGGIVLRSWLGDSSW